MRDFWQSLQHRTAGSACRPVHDAVSSSSIIPQTLRRPCGFFPLAILTLLSGCFGGSPPDQKLPVAQTFTWQIPNEEIKIPAPRGLFVAKSGELYVLDDAGRFLIYDRERQLVRKTWMPEYSVGRAEGLWQMLDGRVAVADTHYNRIVLLNPDGSCERMFGTKGTGPGQFTFPETVVQDPAAGFMCASTAGTIGSSVSPRMANSRLRSARSARLRAASASDGPCLA